MACSQNRGVDADEAFYRPTADPAVFEPTRRTEGLWNAKVQHAGPPSALLVREIERLESSIPGPSQVTRFTVEILGPVPTDEVRVRAVVERPGRTVELVTAELLAGGRPALRARAWRIRSAEVDLPQDVLEELPGPPVPDEVASFREASWTESYLGAVEFRFVDGHFQDPGPATVWTRLRIPLVAGEDATPLQRLVAVADSGNGLSSLLDFDEWWFINTDLSLHLHRQPEGEWICVDARSTLDPSGIGLAETQLFDRRGRVGRGAQSLMVGPRL